MRSVTVLTVVTDVPRLQHSSMNDLLRAIAEILRAIAWPAVTAFGILYFRKEITDLAKRLRKGGGAEFDPIPQSTSSPESVLSVASLNTSTTVSKTTSDLFEALPKTPAIEALEKEIRDFPPIKNADSSSERDAVLFRLLAKASLNLQFEQADRSIWASQLALLAYLNSKRQGESLPQLKNLFYDKAIAQFPNWYENYSFEDWLQFLKRNYLITSDAGKAAISDAGIDYLTWRVQQARPPKLAG
jgi:hypothetical protein